MKRRIFVQGLRFLRLRGDIRRIAWGFALGSMINFYPTFGFGVAVSCVVARALGGNAMAGLVGGAGLVLLWPVLFYFNLVTGGWLSNRESELAPQVAPTFQEQTAVVLGQDFILGAIFNSLLFGLVVYLLIQWLFRRLRPFAIKYCRTQARMLRLLPH